MILHVNFEPNDREFPLDSTIIEDLVVPTADVHKVGKVSTLTVRDVHGTTQTEILDGEKGEKGDPGQYDAGTGIIITPTLTPNGAEISVKTSDLSYNDLQDKLSAGNGISIDSNNVITNTYYSAVWGNVHGTLSDQIDLQTALDTKEAHANKVSTWSETPNDTHYPTEKLTKDTIDAEVQRATAAEQVIANGLSAHIADTTNPHSVTKAQVGLGDVENQPLDTTPTANSGHYVTSGGVKAYVDTYGGKIDSITVNGESSALPIVNKNVTIPKVKKNGTDITLTNNAFDVEVPTKTSELTNDGDGTSNFATLANVATSVSAEAELRSQADTALGGRIDTEASTRANADTALGGRIDTEAATRASADIDLGDRITTEASTRSAADTALQDNIDAEEAARIAADNLRVLYTDVVDNTSTTTTNVPLSANMGKELQDQINNLKAIGRFLSLWDCTTGLPTTSPTVSPYTYKTGDYYIVSVVSSATPAVNYKPDGTTYTTGVPSTVRETSTVLVNDYYVFDGSVWRLVTNTQRTVTFQNVAGDPYDNANLAAALNNKVTKNETIVGATHTKITYDSKGLVTSGTDLSASDIPNLNLSKITDVTATATEVNVLSGMTASTQELNYIDGVTAPIQGQLDSKVAKNSDITAGTHTKITYDAKGLVTAGADLTAGDIPDLSLSKITDVTATAAEVNILNGATLTTTELNYVDGVTSPIQTQLDNKSKVTVSANGSSTDKVQYITIDGVEKKIGSDDPTEYTTKLQEDLYTYVNIGKITGASQTNPVKVADAGDPLKEVFNSILGTEVDVNPTINQGGTTFTKSAQTGTTSVSGAEIGQSISAQTGTVTYYVTNTATCSYGLKAGTYDTYSKTTATTFNYPIKTRTIGAYSYQVRIKYPTLNGCTLSVTAGTLVWNDTDNSYLYCNVDANNKVTVSIAIPANTSTASAITRFNQLEADVDFDPATYQGVVVDNFWTYLKASYTASGKTHTAITGVKSTAYTITAGTRYAYSKVTSSTTTPTSSLTKQTAESTFQTNGADFSYNLGDYLYFYRTVSGRTVQTYVLGQWANVNFTALPATTITQNNGATATYYPYRVGPMEATGSAKYRV